MQRKKFMEVFEERSGETLCLQIDIKVGNQTFPRGTCYNVGEKIGGTDFHKFRYLDIAGVVEDDGTFEVRGFFEN
jgi:hypothetical protein